MPLLFFDSYTKSYHDSAFSMSACISFILLVFVVLIPLFASYATEDFWPKLNNYYDQPIVEYNQNFYIFTIETDNITKNENPLFDYFHSSSSKLNKNYESVGNLSKNFFISSTSYDDDGDGKADRIIIKMKFEKQKGYLVNFKTFLFFDYGIDSKVKMIMQALVLIDITNINGIRRIKTKGELVLNQKSPIASTTITDKKYYSNDLLGSEDFSPYDFLAIYDHFYNRNYTLDYIHIAQVTPSIPLENQTNEIYNEIYVEMEFFIPKYQKIFYSESSYILMKGAWIQYFYIFLFLCLLLYYFLGFIFKNQILSCSLRSDLDLGI